MKELYQRLKMYDPCIPDFDAAVAGVGESYPTRPREPAKKIRDTSEKAFQRAIFSAGNIKVHSAGHSSIYLHLLDYEIPVILNRNSRRKSIDLISKSSSKYQVIEIKFNKSADSPYFAASEIIKYRHIVSINYALLDEYRVHHCGSEFTYFAWNELNADCEMYVLANEAYWNYWKKRRGGADFSEYLDLMASVGITCLTGKDVDFNSQKSLSGNGFYTPYLACSDFYKL